jgi:hypothetical protein
MPNQEFVKRNTPKSYNTVAIGIGCAVGVLIAFTVIAGFFLLRWTRLRSRDRARRFQQPFPKFDEASPTDSFDSNDWRGTTSVPSSGQQRAKSCDTRRSQGSLSLHEPPPVAAANTFSNQQAWAAFFQATSSEEESPLRRTKSLRVTTLSAIIESPTVAARPDTAR